MRFNLVRKNKFSSTSRSNAGKDFHEARKMQKDLQRRDDNVMLVGFSTSLI